MTAHEWKADEIIPGRNVFQHKAYQSQWVIAYTFHDRQKCYKLVCIQDGRMSELFTNRESLAAHMNRCNLVPVEQPNERQ